MQRFATVFRFLLSGGLNTLATLCIYWALLPSMPAQAAYAISFAAGIGISYFLNLRFVFRSRHSFGKLIAFPFIYFATYLLGAVVLHIAIVQLSIPRTLAPVVSIAVTLPFNFVLIRLLMKKQI